MNSDQNLLFMWENKKPFLQNSDFCYKNPVSIKKSPKIKEFIINFRVWR